MGMNDTMNIIDAMPTIAAKAMKVKLSRGTGYARIRDKDAERLIKSTLGDEGQTVTKAVFQNKQCLIYRRAQTAAEMYAYHIKNTLPHSDDGWRVLPNALYLEYSNTMSNYASTLQVMQQNIINNYDTLVATDIAERNAHLSSQSKAPVAALGDYPTRDHMAKLLYVQYYFEPISTANDFRYDMSPTDKLRLNELVAGIEANAKADLYSQMLQPMQQFVTRMTTFKGEKGERLHATIVTNINDMLTHLPKLDLNGDETLAAMLEEVKKVVTPLVFNPSALKEDAVLRDEAKAKMEAIMARYAGYAA